MKKILFASAASLALSAGVASAQNITFKGDARMGVVYNSDNVAPDAKTRFSSRARMTITMKRTTDSGMEVGASFRVDNATGAVGNTEMDEGSVYISGDFGKLTMGSIAGAAIAAVGNLPNIGYSELRQGPTYQSSNAVRRTAVRYEYSFDGFTVYLSSDQLATGPNKTGYAGIGVKYTFDGITLSLGHEAGKLAGDSDSHTIIGAEAKVDIVTLKALYGERKTGGVKTEQWGVSAMGTFDATTVTGYYMKRLNDSKNYGVGVSYNLGGGAALKAGVNQTKLGAVKTNTADFGITMSF